MKFTYYKEEYPVAIEVPMGRSVARRHRIRPDPNSISNPSNPLKHKINMVIDVHITYTLWQ